MVRPIGFLVGVFLVFLLLLAAFQPRDKTEPLPHGIEPMTGEWSFSNAVFGKYDDEQLQRGFAVYKQVCSSCHSLHLVAFRDLQDIGFSAPQVKAIAKGL